MRINLTVSFSGKCSAISTHSGALYLSNQALHLNLTLNALQQQHILRNPRLAYERALAHFGPVIGVMRKGRVSSIAHCY